MSLRYSTIRRSVQALSQSSIPKTASYTYRYTAPLYTRPVINQHTQKRFNMSASNLKLENTNVNTAPGVELSADQKTVVSSVLDLFAGRPSLEKLQLWSDDGVFVDPLTIAQGRKQFEAQWYGLQTAFSEIERLSHQVVSAGNPIEMNMSTRYKVKGVGTEKTIQSVITILTDSKTGKIEKVEDKWDGKLPEGSIAQAFRRLNAVSVPKMVGVPQDKEEDAKKGNP